jgi:hypothetical protein
MEASETEVRQRCAWLEQSLLVGWAETGRVPVEVEARIAFVAVTAQEFLVRRLAFQVAETGYVDFEYIKKNFNLSRGLGEPIRDKSNCL